MSKLNTNAAILVGKYIRSTNPENIIDMRKTRGLQAEINKIESIKRLILNNKISDNELLRFKTEVNKLLHIVESQLGIKDSI